MAIKKQENTSFHNQWRLYLSLPCTRVHSGLVANTRCQDTWFHDLLLQHWFLSYLLKGGDLLKDLLKEGDPCSALDFSLLNLL